MTDDRSRELSGAVNQTAPMDTHEGLLADINKAAHAAGTNAWVRDVLKRAHRAIRAPAGDAQAPVAPDREKVATALYAVEYDATAYEFKDAHEAVRTILLKMADAAIALCSMSSTHQPAHDPVIGEAFTELAEGHLALDRAGALKEDHGRELTIAERVVELSRPHHSPAENKG